MYLNTSGLGPFIVRGERQAKELRLRTDSSEKSTPKPHYF